MDLSILGQAGNCFGFRWLLSSLKARKSDCRELTSDDLQLIDGEFGLGGLGEGVGGAGNGVPV